MLKAIANAAIGIVNVRNAHLVCLRYLQVHLSVQITVVLLLHAQKQINTGILSNAAILIVTMQITVHTGVRGLLFLLAHRRKYGTAQQKNVKSPPLDVPQLFPVLITL